MGCSKFKCCYSSEDENGIRRCAVNKICGVGVPCIPYAQCRYCSSKEYCLERDDAAVKDAFQTGIKSEVKPMDYLEIKHCDIKDFIRLDINEVCSRYVEIGWYLNLVDARELYKEDGYSGIGEYAMAEYGISKDRCSWLMKVAEKFCEKNSPELLPEYKAFSISKLREMVYLDDGQLAEIKPETTVKQIRERKPKQEKTAEPLQAPCIHEHIGCNRRIFSCCKSHEHCCADCTDHCNGYCGWVEDNGWVEAGDVSSADEAVIETTDIVIEPKDLNADAGCPPETYNNDYNSCDAATTELEDNDCDESSDEPDQVEDEIISSIYSELMLAKEMLADHQRRLKEVLNINPESQKGMEKLIAKRKIEVEAFKVFAASLEDTADSDVEAMAQPELPVMKNNDQRKAFIEAYESWRVWIDNKETMERYYCYDLPDGYRIVIKVYFMSAYDWHANKYTEHWSGREIYLIKPGGHFKNGETSMSLVIEHLKDMQKKKEGD